MQMLKGLGFLLGISIVAGLLEWYTITYFLNNLWPIWITAFIILFQPELRQILVDIGNRRIRFRTFFKRDDLLYDELVNTVRQMLRKRIGGLIVLEKGNRT